PSPETLAEADLDGLGITGARIAAIRGFAAAVAGGAVRLDGSVGLDDLTASIVAVRGLGPWTAGYIALRLGERDAFPATDLGLIRAAAALAGAAGAVGSDGTAGSDGRVALGRWSDGWRPWRALAAVHLWRADPTGPPTAAAPRSVPA
ncbi:MAG TPA: hypothetical protein VFI47_24445, partial [Acidimicrobiales bacterium]|nr:hypothetical protein [Acidimicrobiales bacterium]